MSRAEGRGRHREGKSGRDSVARPETEARAGATGSDLVILPSNPSSPPARTDAQTLSPSTAFSVHPSSIQPSTLNYRPPLNPFVCAFPVEDSRPDPAPSRSRDFRFGFCFAYWNACLPPRQPRALLSLSPSPASPRKRGFIVAKTALAYPLVYGLPGRSRSRLNRRI